MAAPTLVAVGLGGAGCNVITWIKEKGITGGKLVAVNTDATHLRTIKADRRILDRRKTDQRPRQRRLPGSRRKSTL